MHAALEGLLIGAALAAVLLGAEYYMQRKEANERAQRLKRAVELDQDQRRRIANMARFALFIPPAFAAAWWLMFR
ncbi:MAG TPA: hypothetical protein VF876_18020 [Burkholderiales bacterium]